MTWDALLDEFRALGGVAENVRLGEGPHGRGIFVLRACDGSLARALEDGILNQLDALSACVGARSL